MAFMEFLKFPTRNTFPAVGDKNRLYIDLRSKKIYYWDQGAYQIASPDIFEQGSNPNSEAFSYAGIVPISWADLKSLRDASELVPGAHYRITDYECTTVQENTQSAGHQFDIIITADSADKLNENARACLHEGDTYFANSKLEVWQLKYCLDNDATRFNWADSVNGKGVIYRMVDEFNNDVPYDFKNIQYQTRPGFTYSRYGTRFDLTRDASLDMIIDDIQYYGYAGNSTPWPSNTCWLRDDPATTDSVVYDDSGADLGGSGKLIVSVVSENHDVYTFSKTKTTVEDFDVSLNGILYTCYNNTIRPYVARDQYINNRQVLNRITFVGWYVDGLHCRSNTFGINCHSNTFDYGCYGNTFDYGCSENTFGHACAQNTFGHACYSNTFEHNCAYNTFGNLCYSNTLGTSAQYNSFGNDCESNTFGINCISNTFGNYCKGNTFGRNCSFNHFGNDCSSNIFGEYCSQNTFGINCYSNAFDYGQFNTFGNSCSYLQISYHSNTATTSKRYISVENGTQGASSANRFDLYDLAILDKSYQVTFKKDADGRYVMTWLDDYNKLEGKYKNNNIDTTWKNLPQDIDGGIW